MQNRVMHSKTTNQLAGTSSGEGRYRVASVHSAVVLLDSFLQPPHQFGVTELSKMAGQTKNQTFRLLQTLADNGVVVMDAETKRYRLGYRMLEWGVVAQRGSPLVIAVSPVMDQLAHDLRETVVLTAPAGEASAICIDKRESSQALQISARIGRRVPLHAGAGSKCLLAYSDPGFIERFIAQSSPLTRYTAQTITDPEQLRAELALIRQRGYSISDEDLDEGACSIAAPIRNHLDEVVACISIASPKTRFGEAELDRNRLAVTAAAAEVSKQLRQYF